MTSSRLRFFGTSAAGPAAAAEAAAKAPVDPPVDDAPPVAAAGCRVMRPLPRPTTPRFVTIAVVEGGAAALPRPFANGLPGVNYTGNMWSASSGR